MSTVSGIAQVGRHEWDRLAAGTGLYQSYPWLHWAESSGAARARYVLAHDAAGALAGAVPTYLLTDAPDRFTTWYDPVRLFLGGDITGTAERWYPLLLVGSVSGYHSEVLVAPGRERAAVARALLRGCLDLAAADDARGTAMLYAPEIAAREAADAFDGGVPPVPTSAEAVIELSGGEREFDDYLARFPSARRSKLKKEIAAFHAAGASVTRYALADVAGRVGPLLGRLQRRYGDPVSDAEMTAYVTSQERFLGGQAVVFAEETRGRLRGFTLCYVHGDTVYVRAAGFDERMDPPPYSYFTLAVYAPVRLALERGLAFVDLGTGAYQGKILRGAAIRPLWSAIRPPAGSPATWREALARPAAEAVESGWVTAGE